MAGPEIVAFFSYLTSERSVSLATQNQALNAIVFLYKHVLEIDPGEFNGLVRARPPKFLPEVLSPDEVQQLLNKSTGIQWIIGCLLYGTGMRLREALSLRVKDVSFERNIIYVEQAKGNKDRIVPFPQFLKKPLQKQIAHANLQHICLIQELTSGRYRGLRNIFDRLQVNLQRSIPIVGVYLWFSSYSHALANFNTRM